MNVHPGGKQSVMRSTIWDPKKDPQSMVFESTGQPKGLKKV